MCQAFDLGGASVWCRTLRVDEILPNESAFCHAYARLPGDCRSKVNRLHRQDDRRRSVAAWTLLADMVRERCRLDIRALPLRYNDCGKPSFEESARIHFNLSHADERVLAALSDSPVGCDLELPAPVTPKLLAECLASEEIAELATMENESARFRRFTRLWVRKESYLKAVGSGITDGLRSFSVLTTPPNPHWTWRDGETEDGYLWSVCLIRPKSSVDAGGSI